MNRKKEQKKQNKPKICFISPAAFALLSKKNFGFTGGAELQQVILSKKLRENGFNISFVTFDHGQDDITEIDKIKIYKIYSKDSSSGLSNYYKKLSKIWNSLKKADSNIYYVRGFGPLVGITALFCILNKRKFIFSISSDMDIDGTRVNKTNFFIKHLFKFGIRKADCIITQSRYQQKLIKKNFNRNGILIKSAIELPTSNFNKENSYPVLWVSRIQDCKQPELFIKIAEKISDVKFQMIGGISEDKKYFEIIKELSSEIPNLEFKGFIPYNKINKYFDKASVFVNTSTKEGFPNTFLQAWARNTPVVSLNVDPDRVISKNHLGFKSENINQMILDIKLLLKDESLRKKLGNNGRKYVEMEHDIEMITEKYVLIFKGLFENKKLEIFNFIS